MTNLGWIFFILAFLVIILGPVLIAQINKKPARVLKGTALSDLSYLEVSFRNEKRAINLTGMLFVPKGDGPFPAVVFIHGSGATHRGNVWYLSLVSYLQENGVLVLLPDKRGSEKSEGNWRTSSFEDLATDSLAAVKFLKNQKLARTSQVGILGVSQGGQFAPLVASQSSDITFLISVVGTSLPLYEVLQYEETHNLREMGILPGISDLIAYVSTLILRKVTQKDFWDAVGNFNPLPYWKALSVPGFVLLGSEDTNVPAERSKARLEKVGLENVRIKIYEGSGHPLEDPIGTGDNFFRMDALTDIKNFIDEAVQNPEASE